MLTGSVSEPGVAAGHLYILMTEELLETFQTHPGVGKLGGKGVAKTMDRVALLLKLCLLEVFHKAAPAGTVTEAPIAPTVKDELLVLVPSLKPELDRKQGIIAQVNHPPHAVLLSLEEMDLSVPDIEIVQPKAQCLADPYASP